MAAHQNIIGNQMTEFMNSVCSIESKFDLIYNVANDILLDLNDGKNSKQKKILLKNPLNIFYLN